MENSKKRFSLALFTSAIFIVILVLIHFAGEQLSLDFYKLGVYPREIKGLLGIITHPLIHSSWGHLLANSSSLFFLLATLIYFYKDWSYLIFFLIWITEGTLLFIIGRENWHIGASGIIYGLAFFLFFSGVFSKTKSMMAVSLLMVFLYGSMIWSMTPHFVKADVSWEGHLSGAIAGFIMSIFFYSKAELSKKEAVIYNDEEDEELYNKWMESLKPESENNKDKDAQTE